MTVRRLISVCFLIFVIAPVTKASTTSATSSSLTYQGRILKSGGQPLEYHNVSFAFQVLDPSGQCLIYQEQIDAINMTNSGGLFDLPIGTGGIQYITGSSASSVVDIFNNNLTYTCGACTNSGNYFSCHAGTSSYSPIEADGRLLRVSFHDGYSWNRISPDNQIRSVPYAGHSHSAQKLGSNYASDFVLKNEINNNGTNTLACSSGQFITWNGSKLICTTAGAASGVGSITNIITGAGLTGGPITTTGTISLSTSGAIAGTYGSATQVPVFTVDSYGRVTSTTTAAITGIAPSGAANGDLTGNYPSPTLAAYGTPGTYYKVTTDSKGRVTSGSTSLSASDISGSVPWSQISSTPNTLSGYNISDAVSKVGDSMTGNLTHAGNTGNIYTAGTGSGTVTLQGPMAAIGINYILRLPTGAPLTGGQALVSDTFGNLSWQSLSTGAVTSVSATLPLSSTGGTTPAISLAGLTGLGSANQILGMNNSANGYEYKNINGTPNQINVTNSVNSITLSTPQNIATTSSPTFLGMTLSEMNSAGFVKNDGSGVLSGGNKASLTSDISGVLAVINGGTNSSTALNNNRVMISSGGKIIETSAITANRAIASNANGLPVASATTDVQLGYLSNATSDIQTQINNKVSTNGWTNYSAITTNGSGTLEAIAGSLNNSVLNWTVTGPTWTTYSLPSSVSANQLLYASSGTAVSGLSTFANSILMTDGSGAPSFSATSGDLFSQYVLLAGRASGQKLSGGTAASEALTLEGTSNPIVGNIILNASGGNVGIGTAAPTATLDVNGTMKTGNSWNKTNTSSNFTHTGTVSSLTLQCHGGPILIFANFSASNANASSSEWNGTYFSIRVGSPTGTVIRTVSNTTNNSGTVGNFMSNIQTLYNCPAGSTTFYLTALTNAGTTISISNLEFSAAELGLR